MSERRKKREMVYPQWSSEYRLKQLPSCPDCGSQLIVYTDSHAGYTSKFSQVRCIKSGWPTMCKHRGKETGNYKLWVDSADMEAFAINLYNGNPLE